MLRLSGCLLDAVDPTFARHIFGSVPKEAGAHGACRSPEPPDWASAAMVAAQRGAFVGRLMGLILGAVSSSTGLPLDVSLQAVLDDPWRAVKLRLRMDQATSSPPARQYWGEAVMVALAVTMDYPPIGEERRLLRCVAQGDAAGVRRITSRRTVEGPIGLEVQQHFDSLAKKYYGLKAKLGATPPGGPSRGAQGSERTINFVVDLALLRCRLGSPHDSLQGLEIARAASGRESPRCVELLCATAAVKGSVGDTGGALEALLGARELHAKAGTLCSPDGVAAVAQIAAAKAHLGDFEGALEEYVAGRDLCELAGALETPLGVLVLQGLAFVQGRLGKFDDQLQSLRCATSSVERAGALATFASPLTDTLLINRGLAEWRCGQSEAALASFEHAHALRRQAGNVALDTDGLLSHLAAVRAELGGPGKAAGELAQARGILLGSGGSDSEGGAEVLAKVGLCLFDCGDGVGALEAVQAAACVRERLGLADGAESAVLKAKADEIAGALQAEQSLQPPSPAA
eukprot:CAMPEP_0176252968 /NCGR_PEP_ID=MMETSP0121_2-20121125/35776_1 /TAXON_ID=160619 /ORGANISM="Kryptoperidinium foliaceum, Strain CCMP 1326" /LENGTH=516 /DNA_ID=CAMNT_0017592735 /DNA_START=1 /DNA_END=1551 /DNA_ORIENTATION=+